MELDSKKRHLLTRQRDERGELLYALELLHANFQKQCEEVRRQVRKSAFNREITRAGRYREEKRFWEYVNNIIEDIHLLTWKRAAISVCQAQYARKLKVLEEELRELETTHRKERINLRYSGQPPQENSSDHTSITPPFYFPL
ncbi:hypothetical protein PJI16_19940 [Nitrospira sp. MA-1]|nr:hypothetical protein [Nitrospira sp. MA-1]